MGRSWILRVGPPLLIVLVVIATHGSSDTQPLAAEPLRLHEQQLEAYLEVRATLLGEKSAVRRAAALKSAGLTEAHVALIERLLAELLAEKRPEGDGPLWPLPVRPAGQVPKLPEPASGASGCRDTLKNMVRSLTKPFFGVTPQLTSSQRAEVTRLLGELDRPPAGVTLLEQYRQVLVLREAVMRGMGSGDRMAREDLAEIRQGKTPQRFRDCVGAEPSERQQATDDIVKQACEHLLARMHRASSPQEAARYRRRAVELGCTVPEPAHSGEAEPDQPERPSRRRPVSGLFGDPIEAQNRALVRKFLPRFGLVPQRPGLVPRITDLRRQLRSATPEHRLRGLQRTLQVASPEAQAFFKLPVVELLPDVLAILDGYMEPTGAEAADVARELLRRTACVLATMGVVSIEPLQERLSSERPRTRFYAAEGLGHLGARARSALPALIELSRGSPLPLQKSALMAMVDIAPEDNAVFGRLQQIAKQSAYPDARINALVLMGATRGHEREAAGMIRSSLESQLARADNKRARRLPAVTGGELFDALTRLGDPGADALAAVFPKLNSSLQQLAIHEALRGKSTGLPMPDLESVFGGSEQDESIQRDRTDDAPCREWLRKGEERPHPRRPYPSVETALQGLSAPGRSSRIIAMVDISELGREAERAIPKLIGFLERANDDIFEAALALSVVTEFGAAAKDALPALKSLEGHELLGAQARMSRIGIETALKGVRRR